MSADVWDLLSSSPILVGSAMILNAVRATVGARLASQEPDPSLTDYVAFVSLSGGFSFAWDLAKVV